MISRRSAGKRPRPAAYVEHGLALDGAGVTRQPLLAGGGCRAHRVGGPGVEDDVVAGAAVNCVVTGAADEDIVAGTAEEGVVPLAADQHVVAVAAVQRQERRIGRQLGGVDHVRSSEPVDREPVAAGDRAGHRNQRRKVSDLQRLARRP